MKLLLLILTVAGIAILIFSLPASAEGNWNTTTLISVPDLSVGTETTITTTVSSSVITPFQGSMDYFGFSNTEVLGQAGFSDITTSTPSIHFIPNTSITAISIQIPIRSILGIDQMALKLDYNLTTAGSTILTGSIHRSVMPQMSADGALLLVLNTAQTSASSVVLKAGTEYVISFIEANHVLDFTFPISKDTSSRLYNDSSDTGVSIPVVLQGGDHLGRIAVTDGSPNFVFTPTKVYHQILGYFSDDVGSFGASYDLEVAKYVTSSSYTLGINNVTSTYSGAVVFQSQLLNNGVSIPGTKINFYVIHDGFVSFIGENITDGSGRAKFRYDTSELPGKYQTKSEFAADHTVSKIGELIITKAEIGITTGSAIGSFGSGPSNSTIVEVKGYLLTGTGTPVEGMNISISDPSGPIGSVISLPNGYFMFTDTVELPAGSVPNYYSIEGTHKIYSLPQTQMSLIIRKGNPVIKLNETNYTVNYDQNVTIDGNITDKSGDYLPADMELQIYKNGWARVESIYSTGNFSFNFDPGLPGQYTYRVVSQSQSGFNPSSANFNVVVYKVSATLVAGNTSYEVVYGGKSEMSIILNSTRSEEIDITVSLQRFDQPSIYDQIKVGKTTGGKFSFSFDPPSQYETLPYYDFYLIVTGSSEIYQSVSISIPFQIVASPIVFNTSKTDFTVGKQFDLSIKVTDFSGKPVDEDTVISLTWEGNVFPLFSPTISGIATFTLTVETVGSNFPFTIRYNSSLNYPYLSNTANILLNISRGKVTIWSPNYITNQGENLTVSATIQDHLGQLLNSSVSLWHMETSWKLISTMTSFNGNVTFRFPISQSFGRGLHYFMLSTPMDAIHVSAQYDFTVTVDKTITELNTSIPASIGYNSATDTRQISIELLTAFGTPLGGRTLTVTVDDTSNVLTTSQTGIAEFTLPNLLSVGNHQLSVHYAGNSDYMATTKVMQFEITGISTSITWVKIPTSTNYGEFVTFSVLVTDETGTRLSGMNVGFYINGTLLLSRTTNGTGYVTITTQMLFQGEYINFTTEVSTFKGWAKTSLSQTIRQHHRALSGSVNASNNATVNYGSDPQLQISSSSDTDLQVGQVTVRIFLFNSTSETRVLIGSYFTNSTGELAIVLELPQQSVYDDYILIVQLSKKYYKMIEYEITIDILPTNLFPNIILKPGNFMEETTIILGLNQSSVSGLLVQFTVFNDFQDIESVVYLNSTGYAVFTFRSLTAGKVVVGYSIADPQGNFIPLIDNAQVIIGKSAPTILTTQVDLSGIGYLNISLLVDGFPVQGTATLTYLDGNSTLVPIEGYYLLKFLGINQVKINVTSDINLISQERTIAIKKVELKPTIIESVLYTGLENNLTIVLSDEYQLDNHEVMVYLVGEQVNFLQSGYSIASVVTITLQSHFDIGSLTLRIVYPSQSFFSTVQIDVKMNVVKQSLEISYQYDQFVTGSYANITLNVSSSSGTLPQGLFVMFYVDNQLVIRANLEATNFVSFLVNQTLGTHQLHFVIPESDLSTGISEVVQISVLQQTQILIIGSTTGSYGTNNSIMLQLIDPSLGQGVPDQVIQVYLCGLYCDTRNQLGSIWTNTTGFAIFYIDPTYLPDQYTFLMKFNFDSAQLASSKTEVSFQIYPGQPQITTKITDYGVTHNITISVGVSEMSFGIPSGLITVIVGGNTYAVNYTGSDYIIVLNDLVGDYSLSVSFSPDSTALFEASVSNTIGWEKISHIEVNKPVSLGYGEIPDVLFLTNQTTLDGLILTTYVDGELYRTETLANGRLLEGYFLDLGSHEIRWMINSTNYLTQPWEITFYVQLVKGKVPFTVTSNDAIFGDTVVLYMNDTIKNCQYTILIGTYTFTTDSVSFTVPVELNAGNYSIKVIRSHSKLETQEFVYFLRISPAKATATFEQVSSKGVFTITPNYGLSDYYMVLTLSNDTWSQQFNLTSLTFDLDVMPGTYSITYLLGGSYSGSGKIKVHIDGIGTPLENSNKSEEYNPSNSISSNIAAGISTIISAGGVAIAVKLIRSKRKGKQRNGTDGIVWSYPE